MAGGFSIAMRRLYSIQHIQSAALFCRHAGAIELEYTLGQLQKIHATHQAYVTGAVFTSVAFLEATINEVFEDASLPDGGHLSSLSPSTRSDLTAAWTQKKAALKRKPTVEKFKRALEIIEGTGIDLGARPAEDVALLIRVRNDLIHHVPRWVPGTIAGQNPADGAPEDFEDALKGRFPLNRLTGRGNPFYPHKCLGHGLAAWGVDSSRAFVDQFFERIGVRPWYQAAGADLSTG